LKRLKLAVLGSGEGTTFQALAEACRSWLPADIVLVAASRPGIGLLERAKKLGLEAKVLEEPKELLKACKSSGAELVCLAGWLKKLEPEFVKAYEGRALNVHPALLPCFGGQGMYGRKVHEAVLASGAKVSGCTVHIVDAQYDHGPIVAQVPVPVLEGDTPETLQARVQASERWIYASVIADFARKAAGSKTKTRVRRALLSVSDKTGLVEFAKGLAEAGVELLATGGTATALEKAGLPVRPVPTLTFAPEMLDGRVKTLHPRVHGGILFKRKEQADEAKKHGIEPIDLVAVNLYPFEATAAKIKDPFSPELIEQIDIGGPAMLRSAAKNHDDVLVVCEPADYARALEAVKKDGGSAELRRELATKAFDHTARYDRAIADKLSGGTGGAFPPALSLNLVKVQDLRYGENPHQRAALYRSSGGSTGFEQLHGKELSYNNLLDAEAAFLLASEFPEGSAVAICKHNNPCGVGTGSTLAEAWAKAWDCDPLSAFGGVVAVNRTVDEPLAAAMAERFLEVVLAPGFEPKALELLKAKKNLRLLTWTWRSERTVRSVGSAFLLQDADSALYGDKPRVVSKRAPTDEERHALDFAWIVSKHVRSNAIVLTAADRTIGIGAGQMSRIDSVKMAGIKARAARPELVEGPISASTSSARRGAPLALGSDAFFPFRDGIDEAAKLGVTAIIQPGGSVRDEEVIAAADEHGIAMLFTGMRHFKH
jgi:phosphoribosylaminoimidazolecarboxamide formyltransferase/IMP cyclohydrolase